MQRPSGGEPGSFTRQVIEAAWRNLGIVPRAHVALPSWEAIKMAVASSQSIAGCSRLAIGPELAAGTLSMLNVPAWKVRWTISPIKIADMELSKEPHDFKEILINQLKTIHWD